MPATLTRPLLQEILAHDPYRLLVGCVLLNVTTRKQADRVWPDLFVIYSTPEELADADPEELEALLRPLGQQRRRATGLPRLARQLVEQGPPDCAADVHNYHLCGQYAADSWAIFRDRQRDLEPEDLVLAARLAELREEEA